MNSSIITLDNTSSLKKSMKKKIPEEKKMQFINKILKEKCNIQEVIINFKIFCNKIKFNFQAGLFFNINKSSAKRIW